MTDPTDIHVLMLRIRAEVGQVATARHAVAEFAVEHGFESRLADVKLAVSEIVTNSIIHGYRDGRDGDVEVHALQNGHLEITVRDSGTGVEPRSDSPGLGMGLAIAAQVADALDVRDAPDGGAEVKLIFRTP